MQASRQTLGYVVSIDGPYVAVNLEQGVRSHVAGHLEGVSSFEQPQDLLAIEAGSYLLVATVLSLNYAEPKEIHASRRERNRGEEPLRQLKCCIVGILERRDSELKFTPQSTRLPTLGARAYPLTGLELRAVLCDESSNLSADQLTIGNEARNPSIRVSTGINALLARHVAVVGATGQGKTHFIADIVQQIAQKKPKARIVIFDVNGEYYPAFAYLDDRVRYTAIGTSLGPHAPKSAETPVQIPYYALGRHGLFRLLLPSEKTQAPSLRFAIGHLPFTEATADGARASGETANTLFDDCRAGGDQQAAISLGKIKARQGLVSKWPHMKAISCLAAEFYSLRASQGNAKRDAFSYGHIASLVNRVTALIGDASFTSSIRVDGGDPIIKGSLDMAAEASNLVSGLFGNAQYTSGEPSIHILDLSQLTQDLMPFVLGSLLELYSESIFARGAGNTHPTLLVLEEAHHYLRQLPGDSESGQQFLAYERLAKEGRKFGLSLLVSTQRPAELSPTVLAQCGTIVTFRLTNESDKRSITAASEDSGANIDKQLPGLARGEALAFGAAFPLPIRVSRRSLPGDRVPASHDSAFDLKWAADLPQD